MPFFKFFILPDVADQMMQLGWSVSRELDEKWNSSEKVTRSLHWALMNVFF